MVYWGHMDGRVVSMHAAIAQLGESQTQDLKVPGSIPGLSTFSHFCIYMSLDQEPYTTL